VTDLDVLRPARVEFTFHGFTVDVGFTPARLASQIEAVSKEMVQLGSKLLNAKGEPIPDDELQLDRGYVAKAQELQAQICELVCQPQHEELTADWLLDNLNLSQFSALVTAILENLYGPQTAALNRLAAQQGDEADPTPPAAEASDSSPAKTPAATGSTTSARSPSSTAGARATAGS